LFDDDILYYRLFDYGLLCDGVVNMIVIAMNIGNNVLSIV